MSLDKLIREERGIDLDLSLKDEKQNQLNMGLIGYQKYSYTIRQLAPHSTSK